MIDAAQLQLVEQRSLQRGEKLGLQRGEELGLQRGRLSLLLRQLNRHIGEVPPSVQARLDNLTPAQLDDLGEALFDLNSYTEVEAWFSQQ